jgi:23S rRNA (cytosine1962-C5)-methyltransferase
LRTVILSKSGIQKVRGHAKELKSADFEDSIRSIPPGEWCSFFHPTLSQAWIGHINPMIEDKFICAHLVKAVTKEMISEIQVESVIEEILVSAFKRRELFKGYGTNARLFFGTFDGLTGLIIDGFGDKALIQINTAGIEKYRELIKHITEKSINGKSYFLDNPKYRAKEYLPIHQVEPLPVLDIVENDIRYCLRPEVLQKVGFYYDHRENRQQLNYLLQRLNQCPQHAVDLFCYLGAWGLNALSKGVKHCDFVDQGDFSHEFRQSLELNKLQGRGTFIRQDVFKFLEEKIAQSFSYDLILCDPPAFAKNPTQKNQAIEGYNKLHRKVFKIASKASIIAFSSCTHYVTSDEFQKTILDSALKEGRKIQLLHQGVQGWDHPFSHQSDRGNYIKSFFYYTE